jgi:hypothetical protein
MLNTPKAKKGEIMTISRPIGLKALIILAILTGMSVGCGGGGGSDGGGSGDCDLVANAQEDAFLEVENATNTGIEWYLAPYAFGAFLRPGECTRFGLQPDTYDLETTRCTSSSDYNCPNNGVTVTERFTVNDGETYLIVVTENYF